MPVPKADKQKTAKKAKRTQAPSTPGKHDGTYAIFCEYMALPTVVRSDVFRHPKTGEPLETQGQFAEAYGIEHARLSEYKRTDEYVDKVTKIRRRYFKGEIGDAIHSVLINTITSGNGANLKVLLEYAKEIERDDPEGQVSEVLASILKKLNAVIPG